ncbi:MAG: GspH/FimT family pseudopilin [Thermodesulfobacteriota bacterium]|nr:GspH/FimT family pseudopilin [Thermodesulfobacteriota bacterium]
MTKMGNRGSMRFCNKQSGFTLIELIVIIAILAVFAGIAVPNFLSYMPKYRLNGAARQVMGDLMAARMKAVKENTTVTVAWVSDHEYKISTTSEEKTIDIQSNYRDVTIVGSFTDISFYSRGTAWGATITLTNSAGSTKDVKVHLTGRVKIE